MTKKVLLIAGLLIILGGSAYLLFRKKGDEEGLDSVKANLNSFKTDKDGNVSVFFNNNENQAVFYTNKRFFIFNKKGQWVVKGSYSKGGKKLVTDSGKTIEGDSVMDNLLNATKK